MSSECLWLPPLISLSASGPGGRLSVISYWSKEGANLRIASGASLQASAIISTTLLEWPTFSNFLGSLVSSKRPAVASRMTPVGRYVRCAVSFATACSPSGRRLSASPGSTT